MLKKSILTVLMVGLAAMSSSAQEKDASMSGYNHLSLSYDATFCHTSLSLSEDGEGVPGNFTLNGMSINYLRGFHITSLPMFIEAGLSLGFNNGIYTWEEYDGEYRHSDFDLEVVSRAKRSYRNFNLEIPVFYLYRFQPSRRFSIAPYAGVNFKVHLATGNKDKYEDMVGGELETDEYDWESVYKKEYYGDTWKRFQFGLGFGVRVALDNKWTLSTQYVYDLNPAAHETEDLTDVKLFTGTFKLALGYKF